MDVMTKQKEQLAKVEKQIGEYHAKRKSTEGRLSGEHESLRVLGSQRALVLAKLCDAGAEDAQKINRNLDEIESQMRSTERRAASLQHQLATIDQAVAELGKEQAALGLQIAQVENAKAFASEREALESGFADLGSMLVIVREKMADVNEKAAKFTQRHVGPAVNIVAPLFDTFLSDQANQEKYGFRYVFGYRQDFRIILNPMVPKN